MLRIIRTTTLVSMLVLFSAFANAHEIHLKSGRVIQVASCWEKNGVVRFEKYGGVVGISKDRVKELVFNTSYSKETPGISPTPVKYSHERTQYKAVKEPVKYPVVVPSRSTATSSIMPINNIEMIGKGKTASSAYCKSEISSEKNRLYEIKNLSFKYGNQTRGRRCVVRPMNLRNTNK